MIWLLYTIGLILIGCSDQRLVGEDDIAIAPTPTAVISVVILEPSPVVDSTPTSTPAAEITPTSTPDGDGWSVAEGDCDDLNWLIHPDALEVCDGVDQNCNGQVDEGVTSYLFKDWDADNAPAYEPPEDAGCSVQDRSGYMTMGGWPIAGAWDCDDNNSDIRGGTCSL